MTTQAQVSAQMPPLPMPQSQQPAQPQAAALMPSQGGSGFPALLMKEIMRFWAVGFQTIAAPVLTALLYLLVFSHVLQGRVSVYDGLPYTSFLIPGLVMLSMLQNAFANASSSLIQSRITGNLVFVLLPPFSQQQIFWAYLLAGMARALCVGVSVWGVTLCFLPVVPVQPLWVLAFALLSSGTLSALGIVAGLWAEKFDQLAAFQNFLILPATFLSGVFYSIHTLPVFWQTVSHWNPIFYTIDGFRHGFLGVSDVSPWHSLAVVAGIFALLCVLTIRLLGSGYKLRT